MSSAFRQSYPWCKSSPLGPVEYGENKRESAIQMCWLTYYLCVGRRPQEAILVAGNMYNWPTNQVAVSRAWNPSSNPASISRPMC